MFLVDQQFRFDAPEVLLNPGTGFFHVVESTLNLTVWIARVLDSRVDNSPPRYRKFFVDDVASALRILRMPQWSERFLYALLPSRATEPVDIRLLRCSRVWQCKEPDGVGDCWRLEVDGELLLISWCGTPLGMEVSTALVWIDDRV